MTWKKKSLLALFGVTALVGVAASASAEDWDFSASWSPQASYVAHDDGDRSDGYYGQYANRGDRGNYGRYAHRGDENRDWDNRGTRDYNGGERSRSYDWNRSYDNGYNNGYDNGYVRQDRGEHQYYGKHRDRDESDDD